MGKDSGIHIKKKNEGKFSEWAKRHGMGVQEAAGHVLAHKDRYSSAVVKQANFARNAAKWKHQYGGTVPLMQIGGDPMQMKAALAARYGPDWETKASQDELRAYYNATGQATKAFLRTIQDRYNETNKAVVNEEEQRKIEKERREVEAQRRKVEKEQIYREALQRAEQMPNYPSTAERIKAQFNATYGSGWMNKVSPAELQAYGRIAAAEEEEKKRQAALLPYLGARVRLDELQNETDSMLTLKKPLKPLDLLSNRQNAGRLLQYIASEHPELAEDEFAVGKTAGKGMLLAGKYIFPEAAPMFNAINNGIDAIEFAQNPRDTLNQAQVMSDVLSQFKSRRTKIHPFGLMGDALGAYEIYKEASQYADGGVSMGGYKADSPDRFNDFNIIPSNTITMNNVPYPVMGIDDTGAAQVMYPGWNYRFPGQSVFEVPLRRYGGGYWFQQGGGVDLSQAREVAAIPANYQSLGTIGDRDYGMVRQASSARVSRGPVAGKPVRRAMPGTPEYDQYLKYIRSLKLPPSELVRQGLASEEEAAKLGEDSYDLVYTQRRPAPVPPPAVPDRPVTASFDNFLYTPSGHATAGIMYPTKRSTGQADPGTLDTSKQPVTLQFLDRMGRPKPGRYMVPAAQLDSITGGTHTLRDTTGFNRYLEPASFQTGGTAAAINYVPTNIPPMPAADQEYMYSKDPEMNRMVFLTDMANNLIGSGSNQPLRQYGQDKIQYLDGNIPGTEAPVRKLFDSIYIFNQRPDVKNLTPEQRVDMYYNSLYSGDKDVQAFKSKVKTLGYGTTDFFRNSPNVLTQAMLGEPRLKAFQANTSRRPNSSAVPFNVAGSYALGGEEPGDPPLPYAINHTIRPALPGIKPLALPPLPPVASVAARYPTLSPVTPSPSWFQRPEPTKNSWGPNIGLAQGVTAALATAGQTLENLQFNKEDRKRNRLLGLGDNVGSVTPASRGKYTMNTNYFDPLAMVPVQYGAVPMAQEGGYFADPMQAPVLETPPELFQHMGVATPEAMPPAPVSAPGEAVNAGSTDFRPNGKDIATKTNNPGNMKWHEWMSKFGGYDSGIEGKDGGTFAGFPSIEAGLQAYETQLFGDVDGVFESRHYKANTPVDKALKLWSNNGYGAEIYPQIKGKTLGELTQAERQELIRRQVKRESNKMFAMLDDAGVFQAGGEYVVTPKQLQFILANGGEVEFL